MEKKISFKMCFLTLFVFNSLISLGQTFNSTVDQRLIDLYGQSRVAEMSQSQPEFINYMNYYVQNGYKVLNDVPAQKLTLFEDISTVKNKSTGEFLSEEDLDNLNVLQLDIQRKNDEYLTYKVGETGTVVVFIAPKNLLEEYQMLKKQGGIK